MWNTTAGSFGKELFHNMKTESKSALFRMMAVCMLSFFLTGCADTPWPNWLSGEPDQKTLYENRTIPAAPQTSSDTPWPNLADVPPRRTDFSPSAERQDDVHVMTQDFGEATTIKKEVDSAPPPDLLPLPPPSVIGAPTAPKEGK